MTEAEKVNILLKKTINVLTMSSPYAFDLLIRMFVNQTEDLPTAAVFATEDARMHLVYNMEFMRDLKPGMRTYVLVHECLHVLLHHCTTRQSSNPAEHALDNLAMDLAVNSLIPCDDILISYPRVYDRETKTYGNIAVVLPSDFDFKDGLSFEQYKELLKQQFPEIEKLCNDCAAGMGLPGSGGSGDNQGDINSQMAGAKNKDKNASDKVKTFGDAMDINKIDSHEGFTENGSVDSQIKDQFERSERNKRWGNLSIGSIEQIRAAQSKQVPWNRLLRLHAGRFITESKVPTRRKWHKYHGKPFLGEEFQTVDPVACYLDVSGSMNRKDKSIFLGEMSRITPICPVYLWTFDAAVENPEEFRLFNGNDFMRAPVGLQGGGGTNFKCIIDHAKAHRIRMLIILTDGYAEEVTLQQAWGLDLLWVITKGGSIEHKAGRIVQMK